MPNVDHDGVICSSKTYTLRNMAKILGKNERWVMGLIREGLEFYKHGTEYFISGHNFLLFVERNSRPCEKSE